MLSELQVGLQITVIGMGLVFALLAFLAVLIALLLRIDNPRRRSGEEEGTRGRGEEKTLRGRAGEVAASSEIASSPHIPVSSAPRRPGSRDAELTPEMLAAVMVAVRMHRRIRRQQAAPAMRSHQPSTLHSRWIGAGRTSQNQSWQPRRR
jgi:glutaconyl-CoA/methylmalonyl-CoA decarboxylase subunit delta